MEGKWERKKHADTEQDEREGWQGERERWKENYGQRLKRRKMGSARDG